MLFNYEHCPDTKTVVHSPFSSNEAEEGVERLGEMAEARN